MSSDAREEMSFVAPEGTSSYATEEMSSVATEEDMSSGEMNNKFGFPEA